MGGKKQNEINEGDERDENYRVCPHRGKGGIEKNEIPNEINEGDVRDERDLDI